jgi:hypothetical protein
LCGVIFIPQVLTIFKSGTQPGFFEKMKMGFLYGLIGAAGILVGVAPQLVAWKMQFGSFFAFPHQGVFNYFNPNFHEVWFGVHGLFIWHPFLIICVVGLLLMVLKKETRNTAVFFLIAFLLQSYMNAIPSDPGASCAFGMRRLTEYLAILAFGFGPFLTVKKPYVRRFTNTALWLLCLLFGCINLCYFTVIGWPYGNPQLLCSNEPDFFYWILSVIWNSDHILQKTFIPAIFTIDPVIQKIFMQTCGSIKIQILLLLLLFFSIANSVFFKECDLSFLFKIYCEKNLKVFGRKKLIGVRNRHGG